MDSELGWVDFSSEHRDRVRQVLSALAEPGTLDELGIGPLRDGFADLLFPGFSTIQTRAKYFLSIPRIIRDYERLPTKERTRTTLQSYLKEQEDLVAKQLVSYYGKENSKETGIIGSTMVDSGGVARRPSSIYWNGLRVWKIIETNKSLSQFCRSISDRETYEADDYGDGTDDRDALTARKIVHLDKLKDDWMDKLSLALTPSESEFLLSKLIHGPSDSIPSQLATSGLLNEAVKDEYAEFPVFCDWLSVKRKISAVTIARMQLANDFSNAIYGAHIRYNCIVARRNDRKPLLSEYEALWTDWQKTVQITPQNVDTWLHETQASIRPYTRAFLYAWCNAVNERKGTNFLDALVEEQVRKNKPGDRARLFKSQPEDLQWIGMGLLNFRWSNARHILRDIVVGDRAVSQ